MDFAVVASKLPSYQRKSSPIALAIVVVLAGRRYFRCGERATARIECRKTTTEAETKSPTQRDIPVMGPRLRTSRAAFSPETSPYSLCEGGITVLIDEKDRC